MIPFYYYLIAIILAAGIFFFSRRLPISLLVGYCFLVIAQTVLSRNSTAEAMAEWMPFRFLNAGSISHLSGALSQVMANVIMFMPIGFLISHYIRKSWLSVSIAAVFSASLEFLQFVLRKGLCETDDIISNTFGALIGCYIYLLWRSVMNKYGADKR